MSHSLMRVAIAIAILAGVACSKRQPSAGAEKRDFGKRVEVQPNMRTQRPAFPGQTRAPTARTNVRFTPVTIASGLDHPWSMAFLPDQEVLITERPGRMRIVGRDRALSKPIRGVPSVDARGQGGLFDVAIDPVFATNKVIYFTYAERRDGGNGTTLAKARLVRDRRSTRLVDVRVIWRQVPTFDSNAHFGGRIVVARDGSLFITTGERYMPESRTLAQKLDNAFGKVVRILPDGSIPKDNPFVRRADARPEVYSYGHRNIQAAALHPTTGKLWIVEHGAKGGDEVNIVEPGKNYGWPVITYGTDYSGDPIGTGITSRNGMEQPRYYWDPSIAPSGATFYTGDRYPAWRGNLFVGALAGRHVARLVTQGDRIIAEEPLLVGRARFRDVRVGPDGLLYLLTDETNGELIRLDPAH